MRQSGDLEAVRKDAAGRTGDAPAGLYQLVIGGREGGSVARKGNLRRQTSTVNHSAKLPLAQGVRFDL